MPHSQFTPAALGLAAALSIALTAGGAWVYARLVAALRKGGAVKTEWFSLPDLLMSLVLAGTFSALIFQSAQRHAAGAPLTAEQVLPNSLMFLIVVSGIVAFFAYRGLRVDKVFGLSALGLPRAIGWALLLVYAAYPFVGAANVLGHTALHRTSEHQPLVDLFREVAARGDTRSMGMIALAGVVVAPLCEEFLFRGYFYPVGKRYAGAKVSGLATAALFAAFHADLPTAPGLFVLALAFTAAYERTGSLLVPMAMHAVFNGTSLVALYLQASGRLPG